MSARKILYLVTEDWYFVSHRLGLAIAAKESGFDVSVATRISKYRELIEDAGITLIETELSRRVGNPCLEIAQIVKLYKRVRPDFVHHVALKPVLYGSIAAFLTRVPKVINAIAGLGWIFSSRSYRAYLLRVPLLFLLKRLLSRPNTSVIVQNPEDGDLLRRSGIRISAMHLIRGAGVDTDLFSPQPKCNSPIVVLLASRMLWSKGVGEFVSAAKILHAEGLKARFIIVGKPDLGNPNSIPLGILQEWGSGGYGVEWMGHQDNMPEIFRIAHIACLPSYYGEGIPKFLLESASCGLPIVTTNMPGCREVVSNGKNGFLVAPMNALELASALRCLILDGELRNLMAHHSRARALTEFSQSLIFPKIIDLYSS